ncbi:hypothetical protein HDV00_011592 [Rhizophlyctis rosea]|nr:hypothetical protein HDV00_011592 [Rhizophlyctis rosea]
MDCVLVFGDREQGRATQVCRGTVETPAETTKPAKARRNKKQDGGAKIFPTAPLVAEDPTPLVVAGFATEYDVVVDLLPTYLSHPELKLSARKVNGQHNYTRAPLNKCLEKCSNAFSADMAKAIYRGHPWAVKRSAAGRMVELFRAKFAIVVVGEYIDLRAK